MGLFSRKKKASKEKVEIANKEQIPQKVQRTKQEIKRYALDYCGQMIQAAKELQDTKKEYRKLLNSIKDVELIEKLPAKEKNKLKDTAKNILTLLKTKDDFQHKSVKISEEQFAMMEQEEEEIPDAIRRLEANEKYQAAVKRDIHYLEGEKGEWSYNLSALSQEQAVIQRILMGIFFGFVVATVILLILYTAFQVSVKIPFVLIITAVVIAFGACILRMQSNKEVLAKSEININRAITLLNSVKMRYVSVTSAVDFACEKYRVHNSKELTYIWEQYIEALKEKEKYEKANDDFEYFSNKLIRELLPLKLNDAAVWTYQIEAFVDENAMNEVKVKLVEQKRKLKHRVEQQIQTIQNSKVEIELLLIDKGIYEKEILEVLNTIERICRAKN